MQLAGDYHQYLLISNAVCKKNKKMYTLELTKNILQSISLLFLFDKVENNLDNGLKKKRREKVSGVGFEPTPTRVDCDLNAAP